MRIRLKILHGTLKDKHGETTSPEVEIHNRRFVIGSAKDCSMRCPSTSVSPHHCEIRIEPHGAVLYALPGETGTLVNDQPVKDQQLLEPGDHLRIGRLEFEVLIERSVAPAPDADVEHSHEEENQVEDLVSDLLVEADEREREHRMIDPESRQFHLPAGAPPAAPSPTDAEKGEQEKAGKKKKKGKLPPGKLPSPPPSAYDDTEDSTEAAQEALRRMFSR